MPRIEKWLSVGAALITLSGCGTYVPEMQNSWENKDSTALVHVDQLTDHTTCEIVRAFQIILADREQANRFLISKGQKPVDISQIATWDAEVVLTLTVDEKSQFNPGVSLNAIYPNAIKRFANGVVTVGQTGSLGLAGQFSSDATRKITVGFGFHLRDYLAGPKAKRLAELANTEKGGICEPAGGPFIDGDLKFYDTLASALYSAGSNQNDPYTSTFLDELKMYQSSLKKDVISHDVTFIVVYGANVTPNIKLINVSANQGSNPFLGAQRTNTQEVLITVGPNVKSNPVATSTILSSQIINGINSAFAKSQQ